MRILNNALVLAFIKNFRAFLFAIFLNHVALDFSTFLGKWHVYSPLFSLLLSAKRSAAISMSFLSRIVGRYIGKTIVLR